MIERIQALRAEAEALIAQAPTSEVLQELRVRYLGRKAELPQLLRAVAELEPAERAEVGRLANEARRELTEKIEARAAQLGADELQDELAGDRVDITLPG